MNVEENHCSMTYMRPSYVPVPVAWSSRESSHSQYSLYLYKEGVPPNVRQSIRSQKLAGQPVLYVPGNAGSHEQVRSVAAEAMRTFALETISPYVDSHVAGVELNAKKENKSAALDFFTVSFNEELTGFDGSKVIAQAHFLNSCIRTILKLYQARWSRTERIPPSSILIYSHSMGGLVSQVALCLDTHPNGSVNTIITLASPLGEPVAFVDAELWNIYRNPKVRQCPAASQTSILNIGGGERDTLIPSSLLIEKKDHENAGAGKLEVVEASQTWNVMSHSAIHQSVDHLCALWCNELVLKLKDIFFDWAEARELRPHVPFSFDDVSASTNKHLIPTQYANVEVLPHIRENCSLAVHELSPRMVRKHAGQNINVAISRSTCSQSLVLTAVSVLNPHHQFSAELLSAEGEKVTVPASDWIEFPCSWPGEEAACSIWLFRRLFHAEDIVSMQLAVSPSVAEFKPLSGFAWAFGLSFSRDGTLEDSLSSLLFPAVMNIAVGHPVLHAIQVPALRPGWPIRMFIRSESKVSGDEESRRDTLVLLRSHTNRFEQSRLYFGSGPHKLSIVDDDASPELVILAAPNAAFTIILSYDFEKIISAWVVSYLQVFPTAIVANLIAFSVSSHMLTAASGNVPSFAALFFTIHPLGVFLYAIGHLISYVLTLEHTNYDILGDLLMVLLEVATVYFAIVPLLLLISTVVYVLNGIVALIKLPFFREDQSPFRKRSRLALLLDAFSPFLVTAASAVAAPGILVIVLLILRAFRASDFMLRGYWNFYNMYHSKMTQMLILALLMAPSAVVFFREGLFSYAQPKINLNVFVTLLVAGVSSLTRLHIPVASSLSSQLISFLAIFMCGYFWDRAYLAPLWLSVGCFLPIGLQSLRMPSQKSVAKPKEQ